jgi:hypothetical protein
MHSNLPLHVLTVDLDLTSELVDAVDTLRTLWLLSARSVTHEVPLATHENLILRLPDDGGDRIEPAFLVRISQLFCSESSNPQSSSLASKLCQLG